MRRIKLILASTLAMATLLAMAAAPAMASVWDDGCVGVVRGGECIGVGSVDRWDGGWDRWDGRDRWDGWDRWDGRDRSWRDWNNRWGLSSVDLDDCFWWRGDLFCEVDT
jgi:hypothetical protein